MRNALEEIMRLNGLDQVKEMVQSWERLIKNAGRIPAGTPVIIPNYLWISKSGIGNTKVLRLISEYLYSSGLMEFYGDVKFFEFQLDYIETGEKTFSEFSRLIKEIEFAGGFRNEFKGVAAIDITQWTVHLESDNLTSLLEYLSCNSDNMLLIFILYTEDEEEIADVEKRLSAFLRIKRIKLDYPKPEVFAGIITGELEKFGFTVKKSAADLLEKSISELMRDKYFDGYKTIERVSLDIAFDLFSEDDFNGCIVDANRLEDYAAGSDYIKRAKETIGKNTIGFSAGCSDEL